MTVAIPDFALIILAHNDPAFLARSIDYYRRLDCHKIIADSSSEPIYTPETVPDGYDYRHLPLQFYAKLRRIAATLTEQFVLPVACDDFFVPETMATFVAHLRTHPATVSVAGQLIGFAPEGEGYRFFLRHAQEYLHLVRRAPSDNVYERLSIALMPPWGHTYSVMRVSAWRELLTSAYARHDMAFAALHDRHPPLVLAILGNMTMLPEFFAARSSVPAPRNYGLKTMHISKLMLMWPEGAVEEYFRILMSAANLMHRLHKVNLEKAAALMDTVVRRSMWSQRPWNENDPISLASAIKRNEEIDADLATRGALLVQRKDRIGTPFPDAEELFPVYRASEKVREIRDCILRHPVERMAATDLNALNPS